MEEIADRHAGPTNNAISY